MHNLRNGNERRIAKSASLDQDFQSAPIAFVREICFKHIEADFIGQRLVPFCRNKLELRGWIDEATDKPRTRHPVDVNSLPRNPSFTEQVFTPKLACAVRS